MNDKETLFDEEIQILSEIIGNCVLGWSFMSQEEIESIKQSIIGNEKQFLYETWNWMLRGHRWEFDDFKKVHEVFTPTLEYVLVLDIK